MDKQLETIKANLPSGWQKKIADQVGCTMGTVNNIINRRRDKNLKSKYAVQVLEYAVKLAEENHNALDKISKAADNLSAN